MTWTLPAPGPGADAPLRHHLAQAYRVIEQALNGSVQAGQDYYVGDGRIWITAPDGTKHYISVDNNGGLSTDGNPIPAASIDGEALTRTNDTNVTLTLGGTPTDALLRPVSLTLGWTGTLAVGRGGTGASTAAAARTNLGAVNIAGDTMTGNLAITTGTATSSVVTTSTGGIVTSLASTDALSRGFLGTISNHALGIYTNNTRRMDISTGGLVGIGKAAGTNILELQSGTNTTLLTVTTGGINGILASVDGLSGMYVGTGSNHAVGFYSNNSLRAEITNAGTTRPGADNTYSCGDAGRRWSVVYAATGAINTSDARDKTVRGDLTADEIEAAAVLAREPVIYQWNDSIERKGADGARWHVGPTAQRVAEVLEACGLQPFRYGFMCHDTWEAIPDREVDGISVEGMAAGERYGLRKEDLLLFMVRGLAAQVDTLDERLAALGG